MLEPNQEHHHLPSPLMAAHMVEVLISSITHYKKLEMRQCETVTNERGCSTIVLLKESTDSRIN